jgi:hypothetical protein
VPSIVQLRYMLGDSGRSLIAGWGKNPPTHIQNRAASCPSPPEPCTLVRPRFLDCPDTLLGRLTRPVSASSALKIPWLSNVPV